MSGAAALRYFALLCVLPSACCGATSSGTCSVLICYFDGSSALWLSSLGISAIVGTALYPQRRRVPATTQRTPGALADCAPLSPCRSASPASPPSSRATASSWCSTRPSNTTSSPRRLADCSSWSASVRAVSSVDWCARLRRGRSGARPGHIVDRAHLFGGEPGRGGPAQPLHHQVQPEAKLQG